MELRPRAVLVHAGARAVGVVDLPVDDPPDQGAADERVAGARDADVAVGVGGHQRRALEPVARAERRHLHARAAVEDVDPVARRDDDVLVAAAGEVGRHGRPDHLPARARHPHGRAVGAVEDVDRPGVRPLDHVELPVALHVGEGGRVGGDAVQGRAPGQAAARVDGEDLVRVRGAPVVAPVPDGDADAAPGEELADGRRRAVDVLVRVVLADQPAGRVAGPGVAGARQDPDVAAVGVGLPVGGAGAGVPAADDLVVAVGVEVGHRGGREDGVGREPRETAEHGAVPRRQRVGVLPERSGLDAVAAGVGGDGHPRRHAGVGDGVGPGVRLLDVPLDAPVGPDGEVAARRRAGGVAPADVDGVEPVGVDGRDRRRRVDGRAGVVRPAAHRTSAVDVVGVHPSGEVADDDRGLTVEVGHVGRGQCDRVARVAERLAPLLRRGEARRVGDRGGTGGCRLDGGGQGQGGGRSRHRCREAEPRRTTSHVTPLTLGTAGAHRHKGGSPTGSPSAPRHRTLNCPPIGSSPAPQVSGRSQCCCGSGRPNGRCRPAPGAPGVCAPGAPPGGPGAQMKPFRGSCRLPCWP